MSKQQGFTLIELLVVIAIIAILAAILFPVFAKAREKARQSSCLSNIKQISLAVLQYAQDYDETFPLLYDYGNPRNGLIQVTQPYTKSFQVHDCPSADVKTSTTHYLGSRSYGYNVLIFQAGAAAVAQKLGAVQRPAECVLMADVVHDMNAPGRLWNPGETTYSGPMQMNPDGSGCKTCGGSHNSEFSHSGQRPGFNVLERHSGNANVGFIDGHAKAMKHLTLWNNGNDYPYFSLN